MKIKKSHEKRGIDKAIENHKRSEDPRDLCQRCQSKKIRIVKGARRDHTLFTKYICKKCSYIIDTFR
jgi:transposase-like protein